ncbi:hypothetical protein H5U35_08355 [Candidatus Aerophobetes bacterium]|nr:hypothetical protein [Candidatus Aerophobetes bacterium]
MTERGPSGRVRALQDERLPIVIPAKAGIQDSLQGENLMDPRFRGGDREREAG